MSFCIVVTGRLALRRLGSGEVMNSQRQVVTFSLVVKLSVP